MHPLVLSFLNGIEYHEPDSILSICPFDIYQLIVEYLINICCLPDYNKLIIDCIAIYALDTNK